MTMTPEEQFLAQLELIERVIASICRRNSCYGAEAEDFGSSVKLRLIDDNYAVIRKFQGKSLLATYLTTVIANLFRDYRIRKWGKWRVSAAAERLGEEARHLEQLIYRDGFTVAEAVGRMVSDSRVRLSPEELHALADKLPRRRPRPRVEGESQLPEVASSEPIDEGMRNRSLGELQEKVREVLAAAKGSLSAEDRLIVRLRFDGKKVSDIARGLGLPQRPLYSRIEKALKQLRLAFEAAGITRDEIREMIGWKGFDLQMVHLLGEDDAEEVVPSEEKDRGGVGKSGNSPSNPGGGL